MQSNIALHDGSVLVDDQGHGPAILFISGSGADMTVLGYYRRALADRYRTIGVNLRGLRGASPRPTDYGFAARTADLKELCAHLQVPIWGLVGHSLGSQLALCLAQGLGSLQRLVLMAPSFGDDPYSLALRPALAGLIRSSPPEVYAPVLGLFLISEQAYRMDPDRAQAMAKGMYQGTLAPTAEALAADLTLSLRRADVQPPEVPTLVLGAVADRMTPEATVRYVASILPQATLAILKGPGAGHLFPFERRQEVLPMLEGFLREGRL